MVCEQRPCPGAPGRRRCRDLLVRDVREGEESGARRLSCVVGLSSWSTMGAPGAIWLLEHGKGRIQSLLWPC